MTCKDDVIQKIDAMENDFVGYLKNILSYPTTSGNELECQQYIFNILKNEMNFDSVDMWEPNIEEMKDHEAFITKRANFDGSPNVVGTLKGKGGGRSLILNSHIDVVPEGNHDEWTFYPFQASFHEGNVYGRGVSDMKGTLASFFVMTKAFQELNIQLHGDVIIQSVIEEESGSAGSLSCALRGYRADAALIPEPSAFKICPAQQGSTWFRVNIPGKAAHGGKRYLGINAIEKTQPILRAIHELETYRNIKYENALYKNIPIPFTINVGTISGGDWPSSVPEKVSIEGRMGIPPGEDIHDGWHMFERWIDAAARTDAWLRENPPTVEWFGAFWGSAQIDPHHEIVELAKSAYKDIRHKEAEIEGTPWATDGRILIDFAHTPALIFGPGSTAHCVDEFVPLKDMMDYTKMLASIVLEWCGHD